jgi:hypothetical protein
VGVGGGTQPPGDRRGGVRGELLSMEGALAQVAGVLVGADGVAAAGAALVLVPGLSRRGLVRRVRCRV